ncbi:MULTISPECIES: hypothetical protein [Undibacterium]|uniref:Uncharacterized protein n=1 Tax=Undibacterium umbellatum TaxID=2762300 RepID=A0ABR6ZG94_9BURK|nr:MULTISPECIES: hypothetical protein [Undibacterium]MBC3910746.1 hypothetical protein [Undibacterium umbellatum]MDP1977861.1 hypothetical protein [Undibacterium sp.]
MPLIDQLVEALHNLHKPHVERALQLYQSIQVPNGLTEEYFLHLQQNSPAMAAELPADGKEKLAAALAALYGVIQVLNRCATNFPFGRTLPLLPFVAEDRAVRAAQETLFDKMKDEFFAPSAFDDANAEIVYLNRLAMIRDMLQE